MRGASIRFRGACLPALFRLLLPGVLLAAGVAPAAVARGDPAGEASVRPGVNESYLSPDLDVEKWTQRFETESREIFRSRRQIVEQLRLRPGMAVADVGAGTGVFLGPLAGDVGSEGTVYAVEIAPKFIEHLRERVRTEGLSPVRVVVGKERSTELRPASVDLALVCDVYHHFEYPRSMLASLDAALRPGGALVVIDFERIPGRSRDWILDHMRAGKQQFVDEIEDAGFVLEEEVQVEGLVENYMLRFRKPAAADP
jgi:ubiquinone/menaquinone biosynthesis C-methylase UbiE